MSLSDFYAHMAGADEEFAKEAEYEEVYEESVNEDTVKVAQEYDASGRALAHALFADLANEEEPEESGDTWEEKVAGVKQRLLQDPEYAAQVIAKFTQTG